MSMKQNTLPAQSDQPCDCCRRFHRKLYLLDGYWLGKNCANSYTIYLRHSHPDSVVWRGYEKKHAQIKKMLHQG